VAGVTNDAPVSYPVGTNLVAWTVTDTSGNTNSCQQQVIVLDAEAPTVVWYLTNVVLAAGTNCQATMPEVTGTNYIIALDNCSSVTVTQSVGTNAVLSLGTNEVVLGAFDADGNVAYCTNYLLVLDQTPPWITCPADVTVSADAGTCAATNVALGSPVTGDNCQVAAVTNNGLASYPLGTNLVTWTVTDTSGNTNSCQQRAIVLDNEAPTIAWYLTNVVMAAGTNCQAAMPEVTGTNYIIALDNCSSVTVTQSVATNTVLGLGTNEMVLGAFDAAGNVAYCTNYLLVLDQTPPWITCPADVTVSADAGTCAATNVALGIPVTGDNCGVAGVTNNGPASYPLGTNLVTWTATDTSGNTNSCKQQVIVWDGEAPTIAWYMTNVVTAAGTNCQAAMPEVTGTNYIIALDNCSSVTVTQSVATNTVLGLGTNEVVLGAFDSAGNVAYCTNYFLVLDQTPPTIVCPTNIVLTADAGQCSVSNVTWEVAAGDNCAVTSLVSEPPSGSTFPVGVTTVRCTVADASGNTNSCSSTVTVVTPTYILTHPISQAVTQEQDATFTVTATNDCGSAFTYQWRWNGVEIASATDSAYTRTNVRCADAGSFDVLVVGLGGAQTSSVANLTVSSPPVIQGGPAGHAVPVGQDASFTVTATNDCDHALTYQWRWNGGEITGATDSGYTRTNVQCADEGSFDVLVVSLGGAQTSSVATLTVVAPPVILSSPASQTVPLGQAATFCASATNGCGGHLTYQWRFNGAEIPGATSNCYALTALRPANTGTYDLVVTNLAAAVTSSSASLTVTGPYLTVYPGEPSLTETGRTDFVFVFPSVTGISYVVEYKDTLTDSNSWLPLVTNSGTGGRITNDFPITADPPARFYRILIP
jgi:hypothetical protein